MLYYIGFKVFNRRSLFQLIFDDGLEVFNFVLGIEIDHERNEKRIKRLFSDNEQFFNHFQVFRVSGGGSAVAALNVNPKAV